VKRSRRRKLCVLSIINVFLIIILIACSNVLQQRNAIKAERQVFNSVDDLQKLSLIQPGEQPSGDIPKDKKTDPDGIQGKNGTGSFFEDSEKAGTEISSAGTAEDLFFAYSQLPYYKEEYAERYYDYQVQNPDFTHEKVITDVNIGLDNDFYKNIKMLEDGYDITVLVNKYNKLPDDFKPELVELEPSMCAPGRGPQHLREEAAQAFIKMHEAAKQINLNITAYGTYRSISTQHAIWNNAVNSGRTIEDVDSLNSRGGHSEHHTGLAVDVVLNSYSVLNTGEYEWYKDKAHEYGFIIRYPEGKEHITGYNYEPWHLRYVGQEFAEDIYNSGLTYEEYYVTVIQSRKSMKVLSIKQNDDSAANR